jgi:hypothetical protein
VPTPPEVRESNGGVGEAKIIRHAETKAERHANGGGRISGEVAKYLTAEGERPRPGVEQSGTLAAIENAFRGPRQERIRQHHFVEESERDEPQTETELLSARAPRRFELRNELGGTHDRPGNQVRKEGHEQGIVQEIACRHGAPQIDIERVRHGRERVERDAHGKHDVGRRRLVGDAERAHQRREILQQERAILKVQQHPEVRDDG